MRRCPACKQWTLDFDDYFGRYRCFNPDCRWMPTSPAEREIRRLESYEQPRILSEKPLPQLGITITVTYDSTNDILAFSFGAEEPSFDLPEPDGRLVWKVSPQTNTVVGFEILEAKRLGVSEVRVNIETRKKDIERNLKRFPGGFSFGRPTRPLITSVEFASASEKAEQPTPAFEEAIKEFQAEFCERHS